MKYYLLWLYSLIGEGIHFFLMAHDCFISLWQSHSKLWKIYIFTESALWADSVYKSKCPPVCMFVPFCEVPFNCLFAPAYQGPRSIGFGFGFMDSLGKSAGKKWSQILKFLLKNGLKSCTEKKVYFCSFFGGSPLRKPTSRWTRDLWSKGVSLILAYL